MFGYLLKFACNHTITLCPSIPRKTEWGHSEIITKCEEPMEQIMPIMCHSHVTSPEQI